VAQEVRELTVAAREPVMKNISVRIMIVDDNRDAADSLASLLQLDGHETRVVYSAQSALECAPEFRPKLVLLDIGLPGMDGYELARQLRATPGADAAELVAVTGYARSEDERRTRAAGFNAHLVKPIDFGCLERIISKLPACSSSP
jgi:CheY-like chemotaxis protein